MRRGPIVEEYATHAADLIVVKQQGFLPFSGCCRPCGLGVRVGIGRQAALGRSVRVAHRS